MRGRDNAFETLNAAATAITLAESNRVLQASVQKKKWGGCWSIYWCFGSHKHGKRIVHAVVPETMDTGGDVPAAENPTQAPSIVLPFVAPPSSPASFLQSEIPSAIQSPGGFLSLAPVSACMYSPSGPTSIFAIGPYAHETQLVSPPVFSTLTTEPSTAPFTPPPESVHLTTPSSPEVPFARLLNSNYQYGEVGKRFPLNHYDLQSYQLHPGSPIGKSISPSSGISISGTSSPFPECEFALGPPHFLEFQTGKPSRLLYLDKLSSAEWGSRQGSGTLTTNDVGPKSCNSFQLDLEDSDIDAQINSLNGCGNDEVANRVSFEITSEKTVICMEKMPRTLPKSVPASLGDEEHSANKENSNYTANGFDWPFREMPGITAEKSSEIVEFGQQRKHPTLALGSVKEFNFNMNGLNSDSSSISSDLLAGAKIPGNQGEPCKNWSFPMMQTSIS